MIQFAVALAGGMLSLLSPCSALLLPSFFAYAYSDRRRLLARTLIFYAGLLTLFIPLGLGVGALGSLLREHLTAVTATAGGLLIVIGLYQLIVGGFSLPGTSTLGKGIGGESALATYVLGLVYGIGGFCSGPILAGILTLATASRRPVSGALLLAVFGLGMTLPLFVLALLWEKLGRSKKKALRSRSFRIGGVERHWSTVISSVIFIVLGLAFIVFRGANALSGVYEKAGAADLAFRAEDWVSRHGLIVTSAVVVMAAAVIVATMRARAASPGRRETRKHAGIS
ncbi:MAG: cytochrome c biogenesis CcdA family protein [Actinomycetota bacterium]